MSDYQPLRAIHGPYGTVEISRKSTILGNWSFYVHNTTTGKHAFFSDYDDAMRKAFVLCGRNAADYKPGD